MKKILLLFLLTKNNSYLHDVSISPQVTLFDFLYLSTPLNFNLQNTTNLYTYLSYINIHINVGINIPINLLWLNKLNFFYTHNIKQLYKRKDDFLLKENILNFEEKFSISAVLASISLENLYILDIGIKYCNFKNPSSLKNKWGFFFKFNKKYLSLNINTNLTHIEKIHTTYHETSHLIMIFNDTNTTATKISIRDTIKINNNNNRKNETLSGLVIYKLKDYTKINPLNHIRIAIAGNSIEELFKLYINEISIHISADLKIIQNIIENQTINSENIKTINSDNKKFIKLLMKNESTKKLIYNFITTLYQKKTIEEEAILKFKKEYYSTLFKIIFDENNKLIDNDQTEEIVKKINIALT